MSQLDYATHSSAHLISFLFQTELYGDKKEKKIERISSSLALNSLLQSCVIISLKADIL